MALRRRKERGSILMITMVVLLIAAVVATGLASLAVYEFGDVARYEIYKNEFEVAEAVLAKVYAEITFLVEYSAPTLSTQLASIRPPVFNGYTVKNLTIREIFNGNQTVTDPSSPLKGLQIQLIRYRVTAQVHQNSSTSKRFKHPGVELKQDLELRYFPLHLFAIFYSPDLEIHPSTAMEISGRVHTNGTLYVGSDGGSLKLKDYVTAVGKILHRRNPILGLGLAAGNDSFWNGTADVSMWDGSKWIDHDYAGWATVAQSRWDGHAYDSAHLVTQLVPPIPPFQDSQGNANAHSLIDRASPDSPEEAPGTSFRQEKFEYKAGLKIVRDPATGGVRGYDQSGGPVDLTYPDPLDPDLTKCIYQETTFYDAREGKIVSSIDINIGNLIESGKAPENGVLYLSNEGSDGVVRIVNASRLPVNGQGGFTIASDDPLYLKGDFNTVNKEYAMVAADAISALSNSWKDENSPDYSKRSASETTFNGVFFQGIVPTQIIDGTPRYSGGLENFFRLLERWQGQTLRGSGSRICLWESQKARGWWGKASVYDPPTRVWSWDSMYGGMSGPPGAPHVYHVVRRNWNVRTL